MAESKLDIENPRDVFEREGRLFDYISAMYEKSRGFEYYWQNKRKNLVLQTMEDLIKRGKAKNLLDIGCAEGLFTRKAINFGFKLVVGLDISKIKLERVKKRVYTSNMRINYVLGSAENLPFRNDIFDLVLLSRVLEMVPKEEQCLKEVYRATRSFLILTVPSAHSSFLGVLRTVLKPKQITFEYLWGTQARLYTLSELLKKLSEDWKVIKSFGIAPFTHSIILLNKNMWKGRVSQKLDNVLENRSLFRFLGHDIFLLCSKLKE
jgi:ubiquinone/menaquinone biosynthesis C-methylase UbiE